MIGNEDDSFVLHGTTGSALRLALLAQLEFASRLTEALVASGALSAEAAQDVLRGTAAALDKHTKPKVETAITSMYFKMVAPHLASHASGLRGVARQLDAEPLQAAS